MTQLKVYVVCDKETDELCLYQTTKEIAFNRRKKDLLKDLKGNKFCVIREAILVVKVKGIDYEVKP